MGARGRYVEATRTFYSASYGDSPSVGLPTVLPYRKETRERGTTETSRPAWVLLETGGGGGVRKSAASRSIEIDARWRQHVHVFVRNLSRRRRRRRRRHTIIVSFSPSFYFVCV